MNSFSLGDFISSNEPENRRFFTIAIDGRGASGKSVLAAHMKKLHPDFVILKSKLPDETKAFPASENMSATR
jgi:hypothetical protein